MYLRIYFYSSQITPNNSLLQHITMDSNKIIDISKKRSLHSHLFARLFVSSIRENNLRKFDLPPPVSTLFDGFHSVNTVNRYLSFQFQFRFRRKNHIDNKLVPIWRRSSKGGEGGLVWESSREET
jgi:hypothetical protein